MSAREYFPAKLTQNKRAVEFDLSMTSLAGAAAAPTFLEGDGFNNLDASAGVSVGSYFTLTRTGVGVYVVTCAEKFPGLITCLPALCMATPALGTTVIAGTPVQNSDNTWTITLKVFNGSGALELATGDILFLRLAFRNSSLVP